MKLKKIIKYLLDKDGVPATQFATASISDIVLGVQGEVSFDYVTYGTATNSIVYDNTVDFEITVSGDPARDAIVYMDGTRDYTVHADLNGEIHVHVLDGPYNYAVFATTNGLTSASGVFTASTTGTISVTL